MPGAHMTAPPSRVCSIMIGKVSLMRRAVLPLVVLILAVSSSAAQLTTPQLLDTLQHSAFRFFWDEANPVNGLIKDRSTPGSPSSVASVGFGLSAICIGADHGWVSRSAAADRVLATLRTFWYGPQGGGDAYTGNYGLFYHFLAMSTATRTWSSELSTIDTALLLAGIIDAKEYFAGPDSSETAIRNFADSIYYRMNWDLMRNFNAGISMGWQPETGFANFGFWRGYNEATILYILALGSPTHPIGNDGWQYWTSWYRWETHYGYSFVNFPPLFGHQYSHCWIDFRGIADTYMRNRGIDYFENSRRATLAQRAYCAANPAGHAGYSDTLWGITASDTPTGYRARGAPPAQNDDGTLTPTAPASSLPFAPEAVLPTLHNMWNTYRSQLWTPYGFRDAFNLNVNWWDTDIIGIDQGPIIIMIENYRTGAVWNRFMGNADVQRGLQRAGFTAVTGVPETTVPSEVILEQNFPNPFNPATTIGFSLPPGTGEMVHLQVYDVLGRVVATMIEGEMQSGRHAVTLDASRLPSGSYYYQLKAGPTVLTRRLMVVK